jgi:hypothetical protein
VEKLFYVSDPSVSLETVVLAYIRVMETGETADNRGGQS